MRLFDRDARALEDGGDEVRLRECADESAAAIDDGVRDAADPELSREVREFVRLLTAR